MADLYQQTCMKCDVHTDCYAYEDGFICMECFNNLELEEQLYDKSQNVKEQ